ncbi:MAG: LysM peptidoglycan-binding domain-containing protein [Candidatus Marinimicrobia bacterium]|nr:LysM peptidoglycan-binding domain-containing protein [Candidatus Neomarinimicrobiota bacterium]
MKKYLATLALVSLVLSSNVFGLNLKKENTNQKSEDSVMLDDSPGIFDLLLTEAKRYYVEALVADYHKDTAEVKFALDKTLDNISEISEIDTLSILQQDDYDRFCDKLNHDFRTKFAYINGDSGTYSIASINNDLKTFIDTVQVGRDQLVVVEDKPGHLPIVRSAKIDKIINYFQGRLHNNFQEWLDNSGHYRNLMMPIIKKHGLPEEIFYLAMIESGFKPTAYSYAHAAGTWQFIASTGAMYGLDRNWWVDERRDPIKSTIAAARHLKDLHDYFNDWFLAMASYNCGKLNVLRAIRRERTRDFWQLKTLPRQTRNYIPKMMAAIIIAKNPEEYGFRRPENDPWEFDTVELDRSINLETIARRSSLSSGEIKEYNPELRRWATPPDVDNYVLRVPPGKGEEVRGVVKKLPEEKRSFVFHSVRRGENLSYIARKYNTSISAILAVNNIRNSYLIHPGDRLKIPQENYSYTSQTGKITIHRVRKGETLYDIARKYSGVSLRELRSWNNLYGTRFIYPGQKLKLYLNGKSATASSSTDGRKKLVHIVQKGETLSEIAESYHVGLSKVRRWNNIYGRYIRPGQKILIYKEG